MQALVERSGFLPWLASAVVNYRDISISEQDGKEADDLPIMILEVQSFSCPPSILLDRFQHLDFHDEELLVLFDLRLPLYPVLVRVKLPLH